MNQPPNRKPPRILGHRVEYSDHTLARYGERVSRKDRKTDTIIRHLDAMISEALADQRTIITRERPAWLEPPARVDAIKVTWWLTIDDEVAMPLDFCECGRWEHCFLAVTLMTRLKSAQKAA